MNYPTSDNCCTRMGWTEVMVSGSCFDLHVSVKPGTDMDGAFKAFCHDHQEMLTINGWLADDITEVKQ